VIGFGVLDVSYFMLIALLVAFLDFLPFFGTGTVLIPWTIIELLTADYKMAIGLCIIWAGGQLARNLIQPKMVGDSVGLEPLPTLFMLYIGYKVGGVISMIIAVPIGLLLLTMYKERTFQTTQNSVLLLMSGINKFRKFEENDLEDVETVRAENAKMTAALEEQRSKEQIQEEEAKKAKKAKKVKKAKK
jgi:hypothetical protein